MPRGKNKESQLPDSRTTPWPRQRGFFYVSKFVCLGDYNRPGDPASASLLDILGLSQEPRNNGSATHKSQHNDADGKHSPDSVNFAIEDNKKLELHTPPYLISSPAWNSGGWVHQALPRRHSRSHRNNMPSNATMDPRVHKTRFLLIITSKLSLYRHKVNG